MNLGRPRFLLCAGIGSSKEGLLYVERRASCMFRGKMNSLAEYIWPATCSDDQRLPDSLVVSRVTFPVNMPAAAGLFHFSIMLHEFLGLTVILTNMRSMQCRVYARLAITHPRPFSQTGCTVLGAHLASRILFRSDMLPPVGKTRNNAHPFSAPPPSAPQPVVAKSC